jgi:hypothetical protein
MATTAFCYSAKVELAQAAHCFNITQSSLAGAGGNGAFTITGLATTAGVAVGMAASGTNVASGAIVSSIDSASQVTVSKAHTGVVTTGTIAFTGDVFKILLIKTAPVRTFDGTQTNVGTPGTAAASVSNVGTDEVAVGGNYASGGFTLTNISPAVGTTAGFWSFNVNPSWTAATFSCVAGIIYNSSVRLGHANGITPNASGSAINRAISVHDFGGTQTVAAGTFTIVLPTNAQGTAILQIS